MEDTIGSWLKAGIAACEPPTVDRMGVVCLQAVQELAELSPGVLTPRDHWSTEQCPSLCYHICLCIDDASSFSFCFLHKPLPFSLQQQPLGSVPISTVGVMACHCVGFGVMAGSSLCLQSLSFASPCWAGTDLAELLQGNLEVSNQHVTGIGKTKKFC